MLLPIYGLLLIGVLQSASPAAAAEGGEVFWRIETPQSVGGNSVEVLGAPKPIGAGWGTVLEFDGKDDGLIVQANPLAGLKSFTVEIVFRPDPDGPPEQRFLHFQEADDHRALIETRVTGDGNWFLDTFLKSGEPEKTLYAKEHLHRAGRWFHAALTYDGKLMRHFVNGALELEGEVSFKPMTGGKTSIGCRMNRVYWFKGAIASVRVSPGALEPEAFTIPPAVEVE